MRRNPPPGSYDLRKVRMRGGRQIPGKQHVDPWPAKLSGRQRDPVHDNELGHNIPRPRIEMRRQHLPHPAQQPSSRIDLHTPDHATIPA